MKKVLVLGISGMLGSQVFDYLRKQDVYELMGTMRRSEEATCFAGERVEEFDAEDSHALRTLLSAVKPEYIINCIGVIKPHCKDDNPIGVRRALAVNAWFPYILAHEAEVHGARVLQIATDCVWTGREGLYVESDAHDAMDVYGRTKSLGEALNPSMLHIRSSIIGFELKGAMSLLEWFLTQQDDSTQKGFAHHRWNGVTTLQFAQLCDRIMREELFEKLRAESAVHHFVPNTTVDKYELLQIMNEIFAKNIQIERIDDAGEPVDRTLSSNYRSLDVSGQRSMHDAISELAAYGRIVARS